MKFKITLISLILFVSAITIKKGFQLKYPDYFPKPTYDLKKNILTKETIALGRTLFYDPILSKNNTISCASCHSSFNAFAHTDHSLSHGIDDLIGTRNAPALMNLAWQQLFMWDGAINHLDMQALAPINHPKEMGESINHIIDKLNKTAPYPTLFKKAFRDTIITGEKILKALSQFQLCLISAESKYDQVKKNKKQFSDQENRGYILFKKNCNFCHTEPLFSNFTFANNGLAIDTTLNDFGRWQVTKKSEDSLMFKIPSLRNLSYTYPYMHDGRFNTINQVINHYIKGIKQSANLAPELKKGILLSSNEKTDLIAFLITLNDSAFVFNRNFAYPK